MLQGTTKHIVELGSGSGAGGILAAKLFPTCNVVLTDGVARPVSLALRTPVPTTFENFGAHVSCVYGVRNR